MQLLFVIATNVTRAEDDDPAIKDLRAGTHRPGTGTAKKRALNGDASGRAGSARKVIKRIASSTTQQSRVSGATSVSRQPTASVPNSNNTGVGGNECLPTSSHPLDQEDEPPLFLPSLGSGVPVVFHASYATRNILRYQVIKLEYGGMSSRKNNHWVITLIGFARLVPFKLQTQ